MQTNKTKFEQNVINKFLAYWYLQTKTTVHRILSPTIRGQTDQSLRSIFPGKTSHLNYLRWGLVCFDYQNKILHRLVTKMVYFIKLLVLSKLDRVMMLGR